ncbi:MAG: ATP-binding protein [Chloroflexi bacterium]|nr:ATP-binding protein [Chloroflexota bacterium]
MPSDDGGTESKALMHDVLNALTAARGYVQLLSHRLSTCPDDAHRDLETVSAIEANVEHAIQLLQGEARPRQTAPSNLMALAREAAAKVPPERAGDVVVRSSGETTPIGFWDPLAVLRILANLLDNAAKYSATGTPIEISLAAVDAGIEIVVNDHGIGVPEMELEAIFAGHRCEAAQAMAPGQGLGLSSSRRLAEELGGRLWATREREGGPTFHLWLPELGPT